MTAVIFTLALIVDPIFTLQVEVTKSVLSRKQYQTIRMFRHLSSMVMLLMQLEKWDEAPDLSRSERHEARVYIQYCCEPLEEQRERQNELYPVNYVTLGYTAFWPVWKRTVQRQTGTRRHHVVRGHGDICSSTFQTHGKIWRIYWRIDSSSHNSWTWNGVHKDKWFKTPKTKLRI